MTDINDRPLTPQEQAALANWKERQQVKAKADARRRAKLEARGIYYQPPVAWRGRGTAAVGLDVQQHGVRKSNAQVAADLAYEEVREYAEAAGEAPALPLPPRPEVPRTAVREAILSGTAGNPRVAESMIEATRPEAATRRPRKSPEVVPGTEHLDAKQRATLADLRCRLRESEQALSVYREKGAPAHTIATAEQWVQTRKKNLESKMRAFGVPVTKEN